MRRPGPSAKKSTRRSSNTRQRATRLGRGVCPARSRPARPPTCCCTVGNALSMTSACSSIAPSVPPPRRSAGDLTKSFGCDRDRPFAHDQAGALVVTQRRPADCADGRNSDHRNLYRRSPDLSPHRGRPCARMGASAMTDGQTPACRWGVKPFQPPFSRGLAAARVKSFAAGAADFDAAARRWAEQAIVHWTADHRRTSTGPYAACTLREAKNWLHQGQTLLHGAKTASCPFLHR